MQNNYPVDIKLDYISKSANCNIGLKRMDNTLASIEKIQTDTSIECTRIETNSSRVEVWSKNNVRLAVNSCEKNFFHRKVPASFSVECGEMGELL